MRNNYPHIFQPIRLGHLTLKNRIQAAPNIILRTVGLEPIDDFYGFLTAKARGGAAEVIVGDFPVDLEIAPSHLESLVFDDEIIAEMAKTADAIHRGGAVATIELIFAGAQARPPIIKRMLGWPKPLGPHAFTRSTDGAKVEELTEEMLLKIIENAAAVCSAFKKAGFDGVLVHGAHSWLINEFFSPLWNHRADRWGGSFLNRARLPVLMVKSIREAVGTDFIIEYRINGSDMMDGGNGVEDAIRLISMLEDWIDLVQVSSGSLGLPDSSVGDNTALQPYMGNVELAAEIKSAGFPVPVAAVGSIMDLDMAESVLAEGKADIVAMGRAFIADPDFISKTLSEREEEIIPCMRCYNCMNGEKPGIPLEEQHFECAANPLTARYCKPSFYRKSDAPKKVIIAGGGPGGMYAAITAARRGHDVTLIEVSDRLGGNISFCDRDSVKTDLRKYKDYLIRKVKTECRVILNTEVDPELIKAANADAVIAALGSVPINPDIPGISKAIHALEVYKPTARLGEKVLIIGGGLVGCETAIHLARTGHEVMIIEMQNQLAPDANIGYDRGLMTALKQENIKILTNTRCLEILPYGVRSKTGGAPVTLHEADSVVYALGMEPRDWTFLEPCGVPVYPVGDCKKPRKVKDAVYDGFFAALGL
ncbi:MAG: FAD-dependent oxidoreductase [Oscillospiraceae bacterium]|jgi:2,4-dienoyl-CoA reductase-like NADH-dependent reductase (Old Yellow Enzyme family)/thioredoxin reductase